MLSAKVHREDIKAALRKRHGTVGAFAEARGLKPQAVADWLRGRTNATVAGEVARELGFDIRHEGESIKLDDSVTGATVHRLNARGR